MKSIIRINEGPDWLNRIHLSLSGKVEIDSWNTDLDIWSDGSHIAIPLSLIKTLHVSSYGGKR